MAAYLCKVFSKLSANVNVVMMCYVTSVNYSSDFSYYCWTPLNSIVQYVKNAYICLWIQISTVYAIHFFRILFNLLPKPYSKLSNRI